MEAQNNVPGASRNTLAYVVGIVVIIVVGIAAYLMTADSAPAVDAARLSEESALGNPDATITVVQYSSYGCSTCRTAHQNGMIDQLILTYGDNIRFVFRNVASVAANDELASESTQCALDQGKDQFWMMHNAIFNLSVSQYSALVNEDDFVALGQSAGLDADVLRTCLVDNTDQRVVQYWQDDAVSKNITGTPVFFVNDQRLANATQINETVDALLKAG